MGNECDARQTRGERPAQHPEGGSARYELCDLRACASLGRFDRDQLIAFFDSCAGLDTGDFAILDERGARALPLAAFLRPAPAPLPLGASAE